MKKNMKEFEGPIAAAASILSQETGLEEAQVTTRLERLVRGYRGRLKNVELVLREAMTAFRTEHKGQPDVQDEWNSAFRVTTDGPMRQTGGGRRVIRDSRGL